MSDTTENDAPVCFRWMTYWPHAVPNVLAVRDTPNRGDVTCEACLWALGNQQHKPPQSRVFPSAEGGGSDA